jgi:hypothetical protein
LTTNEGVLTKELPETKKFNPLKSLSGLARQKQLDSVRFLFHYVAPVDSPSKEPLIEIVTIEIVFL